MNHIRILFYIYFLISVSSCKKSREHRVQGTLMNEVTGNSHNMGGETIQLLRIKSTATFDIFSNPDKVISIAETITDDEGHFDFGVVELKQGDYRIDYVQGEGKTYYGVKNSFTDISVDSDDNDFDEKISIIPTASLSCFANPLWNIGATDTISIIFTNETRLKYDSSIYNFGNATGFYLSNNTFPNNTIAGVSNEYMGRFFLKITKSYNGIKTVKRDTIFVQKDEFYKYYTPF